MLSHVRKILEKAVTEELEAELETDRMKFGFQRHINILKATLEIAARLEHEVDQILAVLDLAKTYDRVVRAWLLENIEKHGIPANLKNQLVVFLF